MPLVQSSLDRLPVPDSPELARPVRLAHVASLIAFVTSLGAHLNSVVVAPLVAEAPLTGVWRWVPLSFAMAYLGCFVALGRRQFLAGRVGLLLVSLLQVLSLTRLVGVGPGTSFLILIPIVGAVLLFPPTDRAWRLAGLVWCGIASLLVHSPLFPKEPLFVLDSWAEPLVRSFILVLAAMLVLSVVLWNDGLVRRAEEDLRREKRRSEELLLNVLPEPVAERLKRGVNPLADHFEQVTVLFADIVGFTSFAAQNEPAEVVSVLNEIFSGFDVLADQHGVEKIKTIGDAYMIGSGLPAPRGDHALAAAEIALGMIDHVERVQTRRGFEIRVRIGIHSGKVVAGVIGQKKFAYDLWGDTVNVASRLEETGGASQIHVSEETRRLLGTRYRFEPCGETALKGRGPIVTHFLVGRASGTPKGSSS